MNADEPIFVQPDQTPTVSRALTCAGCGGELKPHEKPQRRDDPALCDTCARSHATRR